MSVPFIAYARRDKLSITGCRRGRKRRRITIRRTDKKRKNGSSRRRTETRMRGDSAADLSEWGEGGEGGEVRRRGRYWIIAHCPLARGERRRAAGSNMKIIFPFCRSV